MDNPEFEKCLARGAQIMGITLAEGTLTSLGHFYKLLMHWNRRINLTAIRDLEGSVEKNFLDSIAALSEVNGARTVLDLGAGAGFPSIPWAILRPKLEVTLADSVGKKMQFAKAAAAHLNLKHLHPKHVRLAGHPEQEGVLRADWVVSRAFMSPQQWLAFARSYVAPGGNILVFTGKPPEVAQMNQWGEESQLTLKSIRSYSLPFTGAPRSVVCFGS